MKTQIIGNKTAPSNQFFLRPIAITLLKQLLKYSLNDNIMREAAKSLAPLPTAWMDNITGKNWGTGW